MYSKLLQNPYFISLMHTSLIKGEANVDIYIKGQESGIFAGMTNFIMVLEDLVFKDNTIDNIEHKEEFIQELRNMLINQENTSLFGTRQIMKKEESSNISYKYSINANHLFGIFEKGITDLKDKVESILEKQALNEEIQGINLKQDNFKL